MKIKHLALAACLLGSFPAFAENLVTSVTLTQSANDATAYTAGYDVQHLEVGNFTDIFNFTPALNGNVGAFIGTIGYQPETNINFLSVFLNNIQLDLSSIQGGVFEFATTPSLLSLTGPLVLTVNGYAGPGNGGTFAGSYAGTLNMTSVSAVPEPGTYAMMLAGLGLVGFVARRRKSKAAEVVAA